MKRRAFLGLFGGAAVAGPKMAAGLAQNALDAAAPMPPGFYGGGLSTVASATADPSWVASRIADLRKIISGEDPQEKRNRVMSALYNLESLERFRLDALRSIAPHHKARMLYTGAPLRQERIRKTDAEFELADMLDLKLKLPF